MRLYPTLVREPAEEGSVASKPVKPARGHDSATMSLAEVERAVEGYPRVAFAVARSEERVRPDSYTVSVGKLVVEPP